MDRTLVLIGRAHQGDKAARDLLFEENTGLIYSVAKRFLGRGVEMEDLFQIGSIGLLKAVDKFDMSYDVKFSTYAVPMIIGEIKRYLRDDGILKVSRSLKENHYRIYQVREALTRRLEREPTTGEMAEEMGISIEELVMTMESGAEVESLHKTIYQGEGTEISLMDKLPEKENHVFCAAYRADQFEELLQYADHIVFNSPHQLAKFGPAAKAAGKSVGLRVNPEYSTQEGHEIYDPCAPGSRLGTTRTQWDAAVAQHPDLPDLLDGLHFHTLCEQDSDALAATLPALEAKFGDLLPRMKWLNFGGGHHITRPDYDLATLETCITGTQEKYGVQVYLEPGEAWALNAGYLVTTVLDTLQNGETHLAILDMSAACHTPDVIEMPYRPPLLDAGEPGEKPCTLRLGGPTCLAGDVVGDYSFAAPLTEGDRLIFGDMAIYTTCKNNTFNGMPLPDIWVLHENGTTQPLARFGYHDFKYRLGSPR